MFAICFRFACVAHPSSLVSRSSHHRTQDDRAHKMYFLCKTNPMSSRQKISLTDYITRSYVVFGHLVNGKSKPNQTQSNPIPKRSGGPELLLGFEHWNLVLGICLGFRASDLGFLLLQQQLLCKTNPIFADFASKTPILEKNEPKTNPNEPNFQPRPTNHDSQSTIHEQ